MSNSEAYRILTRELTHMYASERTALDESPDYETIMEHVRSGRHSTAVEMSLQFRNNDGNRWRYNAFDAGRYDDEEFVQLPSLVGEEA